jgi:transposase
MEIRLSSSEGSTLQQVTRRQRAEVREYRRARMILLADEGHSIKHIARSLGTCRRRVREWLRRFEATRLEGLHDLPRSGRPEEITALERHQVIAAACRSPEDFGLARTIWSHDALAEVLISHGLVESISPSTVGRILDGAEIKPHRVKMWLHSKDPAYQEKMQDIVSLYVDPPAGEPVLCIDEKSGMQALSRARALKRAVPGREARFEFEYRRNGTRCLFGCFNIRSGRVVARCTRRRARADFFSFMDVVAQKYRQSRVHVIVDNLNTHRDTKQGAFVTDWNRAHGNRFVFHYTPTHGSWLNQIELWFGIVSRRILRYGNFATPDDLVTAILAFVDQWNEWEAHPFRWTYDGLPLVSGGRR